MNQRKHFPIVICPVLAAFGALHGCSKMYQVNVYNNTSDVCRIRMAGEDVVIPGKTVGKFLYDGYADPKYRIKCGNNSFYGGNLNDCSDCRSGNDWLIQLTEKGVEPVEYLEAFK